MDSKAQGTTFWIIIAAVIALVVLIVVLVIFTGKTGDVSGGLLDCESKGGKCYTVSETVDGCPAGRTKTSVFSCSEEDKKLGKTVCCLGVEAK